MYIRLREKLKLLLNKGHLKQSKWIEDRLGKVFVIFITDKS